jgi:pantoate--beta-alanine ligase
LSLTRLDSLAAWREYADQARRDGRRVGFVPTMGALHDGHASLVRRACAECDEVIVSIYVNPRQFNDANDLAAYPRTIEADLAVCESAGATAVATPSDAVMWPLGATTPSSVHVAGVAEGFEGADRPGHFDGMASVVAKLFHLTGACRAYFGEKDFQQLAVVRTMVEDLAFPVEVVGCAIVRDEHGLALSSRNARLSPAGNEVALGLSRALAAAQRAGRQPSSAHREILRTTMVDSGVEVAYADVVDPLSLVPLDDDVSTVGRALLAGFVEGVRLLDNGDVTVGPSKEE